MSDSSPPSASAVVQLLDRARAGDTAARDALFAKVRNYVGLLARVQVESWMRAKVDASDLVQQTLLDAYKGLPRFEGRTEGEWLAWIRQILTHNTRDFVRRLRADKRGGGREYSLDSLAGESQSPGFTPADGDASPSQLVAAREQEMELADAITQLAPDHQEVILLRNLQRLPFDEIAERMGRTRPAVQMLWMRAIEKLAKLMPRD